MAVPADAATAAASSCSTTAGTSSPTALWLFGPISEVRAWIGSTEVVPGIEHRRAHHDRRGSTTNGIRGVWDITLATDMYLRSDYYTNDERWEVTGRTRLRAREPLHRPRHPAAEPRGLRRRRDARRTTPSTTTGPAASATRAATGCAGCTPARARCCGAARRPSTCCASRSPPTRAARPAASASIPRHGRRRCRRGACTATANRRDVFELDEIPEPDRSRPRRGWGCT